MITRLLIATTALVLLLADASAAAEAGTSGWWTTSPVVVAPDAQDGLVVEGGLAPDQPQSYGAVQFALADDEQASQLRLTVAPSSASAPSAPLTVCPLTAPFAPADGGPMANAPGYDCTDSTTATASEGVYTFDVAALVRDGALELAVLPGSAGERVVLVRPKGDAVKTSTVGIDLGGGGTGDSTGAPSSDTTLDSGPWAVSDDVSSGPSMPSFSSDPMVLPAIDTQIPVIEARDGVTLPAAAERIEPASAQPSTHSSGRPLAPIVFIGLALLAGVLWTSASRVAPEPTEGSS